MKNLFLRVIIGMGALFCFTPVARAIMANPNPITVTQPDGSLLTIRIYGDESFHYTTTIDGYLIE